MKCPTCNSEEHVNTFVDVEDKPSLGHCTQCGRIFNKEEEEDGSKDSK